MVQLLTKNAIHVGALSANPEEWQTFEFFHPKAGMRKVGELTTFRTEGSGSPVLLVGLWRGGRGLEAADPVTGATSCYYDAPMGDETCLVVEGTLRLTNLETGDVHNFVPGDVFSISKGTDTFWEFSGPFFKKLFIIAQAGPLPDWFIERYAPTS